MQQVHKNENMIRLYLSSKRPSWSYGTDVDEDKISNLDPDHMLSQGVSFHMLIPHVLRELNYNYFMEYKQHRKKRNVADYNLDVNISYEYARFEIEFIANLIRLIKNL